ncbi:DUF4142 domain-containing protein [Comamonas sp. JC664]|uniref:DUF4142 domain-containing protein n=1 Tax=Comamonas sp. JC664 TaxID=2801917 RepID=UPI00191F4DD9|nr:DUF4142 domain-containing protein [Comamonas sp. JC664]MBL0698193.1 DUF4142 domain-containing protein [Comamonas sp. JC664]
MKRWMRWMVTGSLTLASTALAQQAPPSETQNGTDDSESMIRMGRPDAIDQGQALEPVVEGTGGSGPQGAAPDARGATLMQQGLMPIPTEEQAFLNALHQANQHEVKMGKLAQQQGTSQGVKDYGARLVKDHQAADQRLRAYAKTKNLTLSEPQPDTDFAKTLERAEQASTAMLQSLQGPAFDRAFLATMVGDHDLDIAKVMAGQQQFASNTGLKTLLDDMLPTLREHRQQAYRLLGQEAPRQARKAPGGR